MSDPIKVCITCRHCTSTGRVLECRINPPYPVQGAPNDKRIFPIVDVDDWCGKHELM